MHLPKNSGWEVEGWPAAWSVPLLLAKVEGCNSAVVTVLKARTFLTVDLGMPSGHSESMVPSIEPACNLASLPLDPVLILCRHGLYIAPFFPQLATQPHLTQKRSPPVVYLVWLLCVACIHWGNSVGELVVVSLSGMALRY